MLFELPVHDMIARGVLLTSAVLLWVVVLVRLNGLRSFSQISPFDFVMTLAIASIVASTSQATTWIAFGQGIIAITTIFALQLGASWARMRSDLIERYVENTPTILMRNGEFIEEAMRRTRVTRGDILAKLRSANALELQQVQAVILETTGTVSVLHGAAEVGDTVIRDTRAPGVSEHSSSDSKGAGN